MYILFDLGIYQSECSGRKENWQNSFTKVCFSTCWLIWQANQFIISFCNEQQTNKKYQQNFIAPAYIFKMVLLFFINEDLPICSFIPFMRLPSTHFLIQIKKKEQRTEMHFNKMKFNRKKLTLCLAKLNFSLLKIILKNVV